jgi:mono/diheme cytochrome c family protein
MNKILVVTFLLIPFCLLLNRRTDYSAKENLKVSALVQKTKLPGEKVFKKYCISCHQADGGGVPHMNPPLINTSYVLGDKEQLIGIVLKGLKNVKIEDETYTNPMPSFKQLKDQEIADVLTYVRNSFGNKAPAVTAADVKAVRAKTK